MTGKVAQCGSLLKCDIVEVVTFLNELKASAIAAFIRTLGRRLDLLRFHARQYQMQSHFSFASRFGLAPIVRQFCRSSNSHASQRKLTTASACGILPNDE